MAGKRSVPHEVYAEGAIRRIKTYDSVEFKPGAHLNVIVAPNGTGKSTLVNGICLGLAGKTKWLGRASQATEFIKHGQTKATTEIELHNPDGDNYVIKREIHKDNRQNWSVNGRSSAQRAVEECVARLNIQVGNLCQFLPQDKVADFAKMTPQELLENTEKAVGPPEMIQDHHRLKDSTTEANTLAADYITMQERLEAEESKNLRVEQDVKNYKERQTHIRLINLLEKKRPWVEYETMRKRYMEEKQKKDDLTEQYKQAKMENAPMQNKLAAAQKKYQDVDKLMKKKTEDLKNEAEQAATKNKKIEHLTDKMGEVQSDLNVKKSEETKRKKRMSELLRHIKGLENDLESMGDEEDLQPQIDQVNNDMRQMNQQMNITREQIDQKRFERNAIQREITDVQRQLNHLRDVHNKRMELLRHKHKPTYDAVQWLRENKHRFKGDIYEPMMLLINVPRPEHAKYVENHISYNDMKAFVCKEPDDVNMFLELTRDEMNLAVNAVKVPPDRNPDFKPKYNLGQLGHYGFHHYLKDLFTCPDDIMKYLCKQYHVHTIPIGNNHTKEVVEQVMRDIPQMNTFYTEHHQYNIKRSRYSKETSSRCTELRPPNTLSVSVDMQMVNELTQRLQNLQTQLTDIDTKTEELHTRLQNLETRINDCRNKKKELSKRKDNKKSIMQQLKIKHETLRRLETEGIDIENEEKKANDEIRNINLKKCQLLQELNHHTRRCLTFGMDKVRLSLNHASAMREESRIEYILKEQLIAVSNLEQELGEMKDRVKETKDRARRLLTDAKKATETPTDQDLSEELQKAFEQFPSSLEELDEQIHGERARADCIYQTDERVVRDYQERKKQIVRMQKEVETLELKLQNHKGDIDEVKQRWLEPLKQLIAKIDKNFGYFFRCLKCAGEVSLDTPENPEDYEKYGIQIKVKYRDNENLRILSPHSQSGGERSVATVLFMMAMQELTKCPFRCVDEINQGMDAINERKVYELVVQTACRENTSQYFLLTPKLLPDLQYADNMTVLCIYNGPYMINHTEWNLKKFIKRRTKLED
ncbi:structural maintenance of chromosomes protein 5-like isoform X3 [Lineus longissimus]|uniref:structural maintenance of chromosomes protein 5-like isoform X3 n=1 Tax=Lineus longissimus TaxID=88925 RepID=UPI00315DCD71